MKNKFLLPLFVPIAFYAQNKDLDSLKKTKNIEEVVISGTMKAVNRLESTVPVEVYSESFLKKNPTPNLFEALQNINGVRPKLNCSVCNTGDIRINGLDGPNTMVLIDGMPIVSSLGTVYGFSGIPSSLIERVEVIKGPASSLYGSEALAGVINIVTKRAHNAPKLAVDLSTTTWKEHMADVGFKFNIGDKIDVLTGINYFNFQNKKDENNDNFLDMTLQDRISVFQKWNVQRKDNRVFTLAGRYMYEDRLGGELDWTKASRGKDYKYAESIYTKRSEIIGNYQLPFNEKMYLMFSVVNHDQNSWYGTRPFMAKQNIAFGQLTWDKKLSNHDLLVGAAVRYTFYKGDLGVSGVDLQKIWLPGVFVQDEIKFSDAHKLLLGLRYDHNNVHGNVFTPRLAYKWKISDNDILRFNIGTGYRVANIFTEEHESLGARTTRIDGNIKPEKSHSFNLNYNKKIYFDSGAFLGLEIAGFYTKINNAIVPDYSDEGYITYHNTGNYALSKGISFDADLKFPNGLKFNIGFTQVDNNLTEKKPNGESMTRRIEFSEKFTGTWTVSYKINPLDLSIDYTGNLHSPMKLPLGGDNDPRPEYSPWYAIQNIQFTYSGLKNWEVYTGVKNIFNWKPTQGIPFLLPSAKDPFGNRGIPDPYGLAFDTSYVYAPIQGIRGFLGVRYKF